MIDNVDMLLLFWWGGKETWTPSNGLTHERTWTIYCPNRWTKIIHFLMHFLYNCQLVEEMHMLVSLHININKARYDPYKYSIRKQRLSTSHSVAMSDMSNLHHNCNIWITPCIDKELPMALWPSMNTCRERKSTKSGVQDDWILVCVQISRCYDNPIVVFMSCPWCIERLECFWEHKWSIKTIASYGKFAWIALVWISTPPTITLGYFVLTN